jgi:hypothetical protein
MPAVYIILLNMMEGNSCPISSENKLILNFSSMYIIENHAHASIVNFAWD